MNEKGNGCMTHCYAIILAAALLAMPKEVAGQQTGEALTHFNHVATGFNGAPGGRGLVVTTAIEVNTAMMYANFAAGNPTNLDTMKTNVRNVLHALVPEQGTKGPGLGFGVKRAAEAVVTHIELAVKSPGASETLRKLGPAVAQAGRAVAARAQEMADLGKRVLVAQTAAQAAPLVNELRSLALQLDLGRDVNGNGQIEVNAIEPGMNQLEAQVYSIFEGDRLARVLR
jgi:hypothetical protein